MKTPDWVVENVEAKNDWTLCLSFANGVNKVFDMKPLLSKAMYEQLRNISLFKTAKAECGTVVWNDVIDIAPEYLFENSI